MSDDARMAILAAGLAFCTLFGALSVAAIIEYWGVSQRVVFLGIVSLVIVGLIGFGLYGAIRNPPPRR